MARKKGRIKNWEFFLTFEKISWFFQMMCKEKSSWPVNRVAICPYDFLMCLYVEALLLSYLQLLVFVSMYVFIKPLCLLVHVLFATPDFEFPPSRIKSHKFSMRHIFNPLNAAGAKVCQDQITKLELGKKVLAKGQMAKKTYIYRAKSKGVEYNCMCDRGFLGEAWAELASFDVWGERIQRKKSDCGCVSWQDWKRLIENDV